MTRLVVFILSQDRLCSICFRTFLFSKTNESFLGIGAWSLVNATTGEAIAAGQLPGFAQTISRAELCGALAAIKWVTHFQTQVCLLCDSKFTVDGIQALLDGIYGTRPQAHGKITTYSKTSRLYWQIFRMDFSPSGGFLHILILQTVFPRWKRGWLH